MLHVYTPVGMWLWIAGLVVVAFALAEMYLRMTRPRGPAAYD
jgi:hypothetical protein